MACVIFTAPAPYQHEFYCSPNNESIVVTQNNKSDWLKASTPIIADPFDKQLRYDFCNVYEDADARSLHFQNSSQPWTGESKVVPCDNFVYRPDYRSVVTQFDLLCSKDVLVAVTQFFHLFGVLWGGIIATKLMDL